MSWIVVHYDDEIERGENMKRGISFVLIIILLMILAVPCLAAESERAIIQPRYTYMTSNKIDLVIDTTLGIAHCSADCLTIGNYTVEVEYKLQKYTDFGWSTVKSWKATGTSYTSVAETWGVYSGYVYRGYAIYSVRDSAGNLLEREYNDVSYYYPSN